MAPAPTTGFFAVGTLHRADSERHVPDAHQEQANYHVTVCNPTATTGVGGVEVDNDA